MPVWRELNSRNLARRVKACLFMAVLNLSAMLWPRIPSPYYLIVLVATLSANLAVMLAVLKDVEPAAEDDAEDAKLMKFAKRWTAWVIYSSAGIFLVLGLAGWLNKQDIPFQLCGYAFLIVIARILDESLYKRMDMDL